MLRRKAATELRGVACTLWMTAGNLCPTAEPLGCASPNETLRLTLVRMSFGSSRTWRGVQPGYVFKTRAGLVGYCLDVRGEHEP